MPDMLIRRVPADQRSTLRRIALNRGVSLNELMLQVITYIIDSYDARPQTPH